MVGGMTFEPSELKALFLRDLPMVDAKGRPLADAVIAQRIQATVAAFERKHAVSLTRVTVRMGSAELPGVTVPPGARMFDARDYDPRGFEDDRWVSLRLPLGPVRSDADVLAVGLRLPGQSQVSVWSKDWVQVSPQDRLIRIYPQGRFLNFQPLLATSIGLGLLGGTRIIPGAWQVLYVAGYSDADLAGKDADVRNAVGMLAAVNVLVPGSIDQYLAAGVAGLSASVDGLSNSTQLMQNPNALKYAALAAQYADAVAAWEKTFEARKGVLFGAV